MKRLLLVGVVGAIALSSTIAVAVAHSRSAPVSAKVTMGHVSPLPCGAGERSVIGTVARSSFAVPGAHAIATSRSGTLYLIGRGAAAQQGPGVAVGGVRAPSARAGLLSCNYSLRDNPGASRMRDAATAAFTAGGLASTASLNGPGVLWMVGDDPTSRDDVLLIADLETPMTSTSAGTVRTLVASIEIGSGKVLGAGEANW